MTDLAKMVEGLGEEIYPTDIFPELTEGNKRSMRIVESMYPNLLSRVSTDTSRRAFRIAAKRIREMEEEE